jgi:hypothetical protein
MDRPPALPWPHGVGIKRGVACPHIPPKDVGWEEGHGPGYPRSIGRLTGGALPGSPLGRDPQACLRMAYRPASCKPAGRAHEPVGVTKEGLPPLHFSTRLAILSFPSSFSSFPPSSAIFL